MDPSKNYLPLCLLIFLAWTSAGVDGFEPLGRFRQSSALVGNRLYFFGSAIIVQARENFFLDVTLSTLNISNPLWFSSNASVPTNSAFASACVGGPNKNTIYLLEHLNTSNAGTNNTVVYAFDTVGGAWTTLTTSGTLPASRQQFQSVNDTNGKIYMFGGVSGNGVAFNDIFILDTLSSVWTQGSSNSAPTARSDFSATLLNNGLILYIGGGDNINMANIPIYNTNTGAWSTMAAVGDTIDPRSGHTSVLSPNGHVIIYGGTKNNSALDQNQQLASLDTTVNPYKWSKKSPNGINVPPPLVFHSASIVGNFMILAFGISGTSNNVYDLNIKNSQLYLLDTRNYMWVTDTLKQPNSTTSPNPSITQIQTVVASDSNTLSTGVIVAIPIVAIALLAIIGFTVFWLYKRNKQNDIVRIAGSKGGH